MTSHFKVRWVSKDGETHLSDPFSTWLLAHDYESVLIRTGQASIVTSCIVDYAPRIVTPQLRSVSAS
jgi:hypothetical protein